MKCIRENEYRNWHNERKELARAQNDYKLLRQSEHILRACHEVRMRAGKVFEIIEQGTNNGVLGAVEMGSGKMYIAEQTLLGSSMDLRHVVTHERGHLEHRRHGISDVNLRASLTGNEQHIRALEKHLGISIDSVDWLEGFNELRTQRELHHVLQNCAYNEVYVPAAARLERLAKQHIGVSLLEVALADSVCFEERLRHLAEHLSQ